MSDTGKQKTSLERAREFLAQAVAQARQERRARLGTIKSMAHAAGVAHTAVSLAVRELCASGVLEARRSRGIQVRATDSPSPVAATAESARLWRRLRRLILDDFSQGVFGFHRPLPPRKELSARYGVSHGTLRKALDELCADGVLVQHGRSCHAAARAPARARNCIVLFARGTVDGGVRAYSPRTLDTFRAFEQECLARGLLVRLVPCYHDDSSRLTWAGRDTAELTDLLTAHSTAGYAVWRTFLDDALVNDLTSSLLALQKPVALFSDAGPAVVTQGSAHSRLRSFGAQTEFEAGREVGLSLLTQSHRRVVCFAAGPTVAWSQERIEGIRSAYELAGHRDQVVVAIPDERRWPLPSLDEVVTHARVAKLAMDVLKRIGEPARMRLRATAVETVMDAIQAAAIRDAYALVFRPLFAEALQDVGTTAWVGANDVIAIEALGFLRESGVTVPGRISVVGFDDSGDASQHSLSSYNCNAAAMVYATIGHLLAPRPRGAHKGPEATVVKGFLHERMTTARAGAIEQK